MSQQSKSRIMSEPGSREYGGGGRSPKPRHKSDSSTKHREGSGHRDGSGHRKRTDSGHKKGSAASSSKQRHSSGNSNSDLEHLRSETGTSTTLRESMGGYPKDYGNKKVQESDGNFFESFTALSWKQENRKNRAKKEDELQAKKPPPLETSIIPRSPEKLTRKEFEQLYIEVLYTIKHKIGATSDGHLPYMQDLYLYARDAFAVTPEDHAKLLGKASESKPPILILDATVVEARDLEAKDADGFSDPYCMMGIVPVSFLEDSLQDHGSMDDSSDEEGASGKHKREGTLKRFSHSLRKKKDKDKSTVTTARDLIPAKYIRTTSVISNNLNPEWNERFRFDLESKNDTIHLDIWDHDDESSVVDAAKQLNHVKGFKGLGRYFKQIAQSARTSDNNVDDFLGSINLYIKDIPSTGIDEWFELEGRSSRSNVQGLIHLRLRLATREDKGYSEEDNFNDIQEHEDLMGVFIEYELSKFKYEVYQWNGHLPQAAITILHQHAIQGDITEVQQAMCRWCAYSRKHRQHPFDWHLLLTLLEELNDLWQPAELNRDEEECLAESFNQFIDYCLSLIGRQREAYPPSNKTAQIRLQFMLRCLDFLYGMPAFKKCCTFKRERLHTEIVTCVKKSSTEWYEKHRNAITSRSDREEEVISNLIELTNVLNTDMQKALQYYNPLYQKLLSVTGYDYFTLVYKTIEKLLGDDLMRDLQHISFVLPETEEEGSGGENFTAQITGSTLFELYLAVHEFCNYKESLPPDERRHLTVTQYYEWYKVPVQRFLNMSKYKAMRRIKKAVDLDKVGEVDGAVKQSTSAVDVSCCFGQVLEFWKCIDWPDNIGSLPFVKKITEDMCQGATYYADLIHEKLKEAGYYDEVGQFDVKEQLCRTINDIERVRKSLEPVPKFLKFDVIIHEIERTKDIKGLNKAQSDLYGTLRNADECMVKKIKQVVDRVADKMRPDIKKFVFHLCWSAEKVPASEAIRDLMVYLDRNLFTLTKHLLERNLDRILDSIWVELLEEVQDVLDKEEMKACWFFTRLYESLNIMVEFFYAEGKGLKMTAIKNEPYKMLHRRLSLNKADTNELLEEYFIEKIAEQQNSTTTFGTLSVRVYYNNDAEILSVEVLNARNVIPLDPNGLSDPFVLIELCPKHTFPQQTVQQTQIIKKTLNPTFDESFEFAISASQCRYPGACIQFTVMDHDLIMSNDFAGECFLALRDIPGITGQEVSGFSALTPLCLNLTQPKRRTHTRAKDALDALRIRDDDKVAQEFYKKRKSVEAQAQS